MSDINLSDQESPVPQPNVPSGSSAGALLRQAREAQGLHIAALAVALKVPVKKLEALEADRYDLLTDTVFVRSLALSVCRSLKVDPAAVLQALPKVSKPTMGLGQPSLNASFGGSKSMVSRQVLAHLKNPLGIAVVVLCVAILVVMFWPTRDGSDPESLPVNDTSLSTEPVVEQIAYTPEVVAAPVSASAATSFASAAEATASIASGAPTQTTSGAPLLTLTARGASWVEVTDAKGVLQLRKLTTDGEVLQVSGMLPLAVVLGRADVVSVAVRGQALDVAAVSKNNVARFEVK